jgi:RNA polymerase sigma-70 factor (ECF subfamily)
MQSTATIDATDEDLARRARAGSVECFEDLVRRYQVPLLRFLQRRGPNRQDAEDVIQDAFLRAYQSLDRYREDQPFKPWLFTIAYRLAIDGARRRKFTAGAVEHLKDDRNDGPMNSAAASDSKQHLWNVVRRVLKDEIYAAVWLHYGESMPTEDIAAVIGRSRDWVKTSLMRARIKIKAALEEPMESQPMKMQRVP